LAVRSVVVASESVGLPELRRKSIHDEVQKLEDELSAGLRGSCGRSRLDKE
jgi:hypothetical protein